MRRSFPIDDAALGRLCVWYVSFPAAVRFVNSELANITPDKKIQNIPGNFVDAGLLQALPPSRRKLRPSITTSSGVFVAPTAEEGVSMDAKVSDIESSLARCLQADEQQKNWAFSEI